MRFAVLASPDSWYPATCRAPRRRRHELTIAAVQRDRGEARSATVSCDHEPAPLQSDDFDASSSARCRRGRWSRSSSAWIACPHSKRAGGVVLNPPRAIEAAVDKFLTSAKLRPPGCSTPRTIVCQTGTTRWPRSRRSAATSSSSRCSAAKGAASRGCNDEALAAAGVQDARAAWRRALRAGVHPARGARLAAAGARRQVSACGAAIRSTGGPT